MLPRCRYTAQHATYTPTADESYSPRIRPLIQCSLTPFLKKRRIDEYSGMEVHDIRWKNMNQAKSRRHLPRSYPSTGSEHILSSYHHLARIHYYITTRNIRLHVEDLYRICLNHRLRTSCERNGINLAAEKRRCRGSSKYAFAVASVPKDRSTTSSPDLESMLMRLFLQPTLFCSGRTNRVLYPHLFQPH